MILWMSNFLDRQYVQLVIIPVAFTLCGFVGIAVTSTGIVLYGQVLWSPLLLIDQWTNRPAAFFAAASFALATLGTNVSANTISAANDLTALWPRYINIRRGQIICAFLGGWALCPWEILATYVRYLSTIVEIDTKFHSVAGFLSFMNGYTVFLGPFAGIMIADYWLVHRGRVDVPAMYNPYGRYRYTYGIVSQWFSHVHRLLSLMSFVELACSSGALYRCTSSISRIDKLDKSIYSNWWFCLFVSYCLDVWGGCMSFYPRLNR
jgi:NCS1 family nucleobase:cation symporter-1